MTALGSPTALCGRPNTNRKQPESQATPCRPHITGGFSFASRRRWDRSLSKTGVAVEKLQLSENQVKCGDRKYLPEPRKSFPGHPDAIQFLRISGRRVFQQPQAITPRTPIAESKCR